MVEAYLLANEALKLIWADLSKTFESGDLGVWFEVLDRLKALFLGVAIAYLLFILYAEEWRLEDIDMAFLHEVWEELEEESKHEQSNVHTVDIGIGSDDDFVVAQLVQSVLDIEG